MKRNNELSTRDCNICSKPYSYQSKQTSKYCSTKCRQISYKQGKIKGIINIDYVICGICGFKYREINDDHLSTHKIDKKEYDKTYGNRTSEKTRLKKDTLTLIMCDELSKKLSYSHTLESYIKKNGEKLGTEIYDSIIYKKRNAKTLETYKVIYGDEVGQIKHKELQNNKFKNTIEEFIGIYGDELGTKNYNKWKEGVSNKNNIDVYIKIYGDIIGPMKWKERNKKISNSNTKIENVHRKDFELYLIAVRKYTDISISMYHLENIELRGIEYGYDLDHMLSKVDGFNNNIPAYIIGHISNLKVIPSSENRSKQRKSTITVEYLTEKYISDVDYINRIKYEI